MIVTSKRCFLNKFIQWYPAEVILNANYYLPDEQPPSNGVNISVDRRRNSYGEIEEVEGVSATFTSGYETLGSMFHVRYAKELDPSSFCAQKVMGEITDKDFIPPEVRYMDHLKKGDVMQSIYHAIFGSMLQGNNLQILVIDDDAMAKRFGHIMCQYLSMIFGVDIEFIDPAFRPDCRGQVQYKGDKEMGMRMAKYLEDQRTLSQFNEAVTQSNARHSLSNVQNFLKSFEAPELMEIYNLIFPEAPLPRGNYTADQLREIIIQFTTQNVNLDVNSFANVLLQHDWQSIVYDRAAREAEDFGYDDTGLF